MIHAEEFITRYYEMDESGLLRPQTICNYMEEAAGVHADSLAVGVDALGAEGSTWVLAKLRLDVSRLPGGHERLRLETWPVTIERAQFRRDFLLFDAEGKALASAVSQWVVVNLESRRIERVPEEFQRLRPEHPRFALQDADIRIPSLPKDAAEGPAFAVRLSDIDRNRHVNNNKYIDFILEAADVFGACGRLSRLDVIFRSEGLRGDVIGSRICREADANAAQGGQTLLHSLYRTSDGQELVRARSVRRE